MSTSIEFYIEYRNQVAIQLPVNPEKLQIVSSGKNSTIDVVNLGEVNLLKTPGLQTLSFESFIPTGNPNATYVQKGITIFDPDFYKNFFLEAQAQKAPVNFVVTGLNISLTMSIEGFEYWWSESDTDMHFKVELKQYRHHSIKIASISSPTSQAATQSNSRTNAAKKVTIGSTVRVNGRLYLTSDKTAPGKTEKDAIRKVNFIKVGKPCPYHVTTLDGGWRGWVIADAVEVID